MNKQTITLADVFHRGFTDYCKHGPTLSHEQYKVARAIMNCHTAKLGGHIFQCERCRHEKIAYNSCRNRHCPSCQAAARDNYLGATIGFIAVLHTWGQALMDHPHLHCVVPAGGLSEDLQQ